jgi:hypothetical protein
MFYKGSCHCGMVTFEVEGTLEKVMECNCSHCSRKAYLLWFVPRTQFRLHTAPTNLSTYTFNKHVIQHHFCPQCGCAPFASGRDRTGAETAAVNARCLESVDLATLVRVPVDGRSF